MQATADAGVRRRRTITGFALTLLAPVLFTTPAPVTARPLNVEFKFTPYLPPARDAEKVTTVEGVVELELNGVPMMDLPIESKSALLMDSSEEGIEVFPAVWINALELQPLLRRGDNLLRLTFTPKSGTVPYRSQFRWAVIEDRTTTSTTARGSEMTTNHGAEGREDRGARGPVAVQKAFQAPFARVEPWHAAPAVTTLTPADRAAILELLRARAALFSPDFEAAYRFLGRLPKDQGITLDMPEVRRLGCLEAGYATGMRVAAPADADLKLVTTGSPVVVASGKEGFVMSFPHEPGMAERYVALPNDRGFCLAITFNMLFPKRMLLVKGLDGQWQMLR
ncbi:hypothetical protein NZK32_07435 [Cyanobium sp. FGCU-52]|nr:hypothetical protein [Cyanobium sp. FGCU52]